MATKKRGLGKGLDAIFAENDTEDRDSAISLKISEIEPTLEQPRKDFNEAALAELADSISQHGILQPLLVRPILGGGYQIVAGERRWRAARMAGLSEVPAIIREMNDSEVMELALIENLQREELTAIEEAVAYQKLLELHDLTQEALAQRLGKGQSTVANKLRLLKLPQAVQDAILQRQITERHARAIITAKEEPLQLELLEKTIAEGWNVRQLEEQVLSLLYPNEEEAPVRKKKARRKVVSRDVRIALNTIRQSLTMVSDSGIQVKTEEEDTEEYYQITVKIPKKKK